MSDLAPFVAAVLRDKAFDDLLEENRALQKTQTDARTVEITGPGGTPVYASAMISEGEYQAVGERWSVNLTQQVECSLESLFESEIRLGGTPLVGLSVVDKSQYYSLAFLFESLDENGMGLFTVRTGRNQCLTLEDLEFEVGPFESYEEYSNLLADEEGNLFGSLLDGRATKEASFTNLNFRAANMKQAFKTLGVPDFSQLS